MRRHSCAAAALLCVIAAPAPGAGAEYTVAATQVRWANDLVITGQAACDTGQLPLSLLREAYFGRERMMRCTDAVLALPQDDPSTPEDEERGEGNEVALEAYRQSCLVSFASVTDPNGGFAGNRATSRHLISMSSAAEVDRLSRSVGTLSSTIVENYCSATLVDFGDGASTLVTAAHCLGELAPEEGGRAVLKSVRPKIEFRTLSGEQVTLRLAKELRGHEIAYPNEDVVGLPLPIAPDGIVPVSSVSPALFEPLLVVGANPYLSGKKSKTAAPPDLADLIAVSLEPYCVSFGQSAEGRLFHNCQTDHSQSGSAILAIRDGQFVFNGVHTRGDETQEYPCTGAIGSYNSGLAIGRRHRQ